MSFCEAGEKYQPTKVTRIVAPSLTFQPIGSSSIEVPTALIYAVPKVQFLHASTIASSQAELWTA